MKYSSPSCGAISTFFGITRNHHGGNPVKTLSYDCHDLMTYKKLREMCAEVRAEHADIRKIAIFHRLGEVGIGEASVVIATSSPHRKTAIEATGKLIDILKEKAPIFKYEEYREMEGKWKSNEQDKADRQLL